MGKTPENPERQIPMPGFGDELSEKVDPDRERELRIRRKYAEESLATLHPKIDAGEVIRITERFVGICDLLPDENRYILLNLAERILPEEEGDPRAALRRIFQDDVEAKAEDKQG